MKNIEKGFTFLELAVIVSIVTIMVSVSVNIFSRLYKNQKLATTKGNLGMLRASANIYFTNTEGVWPFRLSSMVGKYLPKMLYSETVFHPKTAEEYISTEINDDITNGGKWFYNNKTGNIRVNCTHKDRTNKPICEW